MTRNVLKPTHVGSLVYVAHATTQPGNRVAKRSDTYDRMSFVQTWRTRSLLALRQEVRKAIVAGVAHMLPRGRKQVGERWELHWQMSCLTPVMQSFAYKGKDWPAPYLVTRFSRCRKCSECLDSKRRYWAARAVDEVLACPRTFMVTLTSSPTNDQILEARLARGVGFADLTSSEVFTRRASIFGYEVTKWLKRFKQEAHRAGRPVSKGIRYLQVAEAHDSERTATIKKGMPHFHLLLHEQVVGAVAEGNPLNVLGQPEGTVDGEYVSRKVYDKNGAFLRWGVFLTDEAMVRTQWSLGFSKVEWCPDSKAAYYLCKYMSKDMGMFRVKASKHYGGAAETTSVTSKSVLPTTEGVGSARGVPPSKAEEKLWLPTEEEQIVRGKVTDGN